ncbi:MAG: hypothetical protein CLLPBCKN_000478 [Chroococcidiopsis cubana SAG 39.79]|nr:hypothetical protein [Chroococcidiopsis cubana SAG 39.79]
MLKYQVAYRNLRLAVQNLKLVRGISSVGRALRSHRYSKVFKHLHCQNYTKLYLGGHTHRDTQELLC